MSIRTEKFVDDAEGFIGAADLSPQQRRNYWRRRPEPPAKAQLFAPPT
ncbi:MAG: hypothetical protein H6641_22610 [Caldilineaceae bacterium]|nr:hypothetical protein [Caldilineaceae bacterium]